MAKIETSQLKTEFENYLNYWLNHMITPDGSRFFPEMSASVIPNKKADMGVMYLSRIIYGASAGVKTLNDDRFKHLADLSLKMLMGFKNPKGGYYWGRKPNMEWLHDEDNVNMAQGFVLYGLAEYRSLTRSPEIDQLIKDQLNFILTTLKDLDKPFYLDGFDENWMKGGEMTRSFGTHFHILEALVKVYEVENNEELRLMISNLLEVILDRFIDKDKYFCLHRFSKKWELYPNENWAGHNAECSWVMCETAKAINDIELIKKTETLAVLMMDEVIRLAKDPIQGGYANVISNKGIQEKSWWPQAEIALGLLNVYKITGNSVYKDLAHDQILYIQKYFVSETGEWHTQLDEKGVPLQGIPQVFFWKSIYHTVRYYDYLLNYLGSNSN